ncbi:PPE family protein [Mycobacterium haemophilum]|uniref:PPE domain-containing protein n=1 Tax=Mycobacterium haemophilum TaxID=29311 RepID=A0A0I9U6U7_9MYCO|nr:PPE family protein [Mycobacterium haemophilum]KLO30721.1 hypothetical protein ABH39_10155 [Mycobacterium haemophilum]KLO37764.1 hypothetical protein ABH38_07365 [Mycobacterium haemophilum]KLO43156.1 hypothetical protein ABH37_07720 [Mycobacterium haemophilum]KLO55586.1 hypothetical protein ABH36_06320 [Mycobacterium haemophilum]
MPNLPPEAIANYLRRGPGPTSMGRAACQWRVLRAEIMDLESRFNHMLLSLTTQWLGPIATQVIEAAKPFLRWLNDLSAKLFETKEQIFRIICAYLNAYHAVVSTARIAANHTRRAQLLVNDPLGQNAAEIAQLDEQYLRFWTHNGRVWERYRSELSDALSQITPFPPPPPPIANHTGLIQPVRTDSSASSSS